MINLLWDRKYVPEKNEEYYKKIRKWKNLREVENKI